VPSAAPPMRRPRAAARQRRCSFRASQRRRCTRRGWGGRARAATEGGHRNAPTGERRSRSTSRRTSPTSALVGSCCTLACRTCVRAGAAGLARRSSTRAVGGRREPGRRRSRAHEPHLLALPAANSSSSGGSGPRSGRRYTATPARRQRRQTERTSSGVVCQTITRATTSRRRAPALHARSHAA
jgi:hypothetical protein